MATERGRGSAPRKPARQTPATAPGPGPGRPSRPSADEPVRFERRSAPEPPQARRGSPPARPRQPAIPGAPAVLSDLFRGSLQMVGQMTGIETAARAMERLASSADRAAEILDRVSADRIEHLAEAAERAVELLDRVETEVGLDRVINVLERLERLSETADQMNRSLRAVERLALDVQKKVIEPLDRLPIPRALRGGLGGGQKPKR